MATEGRLDGSASVIVVYFNSIPFGEQHGATIACKQVEVGETIPQGAIWIDLFNPTITEDRKVEDFVGGPVPTKSDPDYTEPLEAHYAENGARYMHASVLSEPDETPDITGVTFVVTPAVRTPAVVGFQSSSRTRYLCSISCGMG